MYVFFGGKLAKGGVPNDDENEDDGINLEAFGGRMTTSAMVVNNTQVHRSYVDNVVVQEFISILFEKGPTTFA